MCSPDPADPVVFFGRIMAEPQKLLQGKIFQEIVREDFRKNNKDGLLGFEKTRMLKGNRKGRLDVLVTDLGDYVAVYEIKATDWDRIKPKNIKKNAWKHQRQLIKYVDSYVEEDVDVSLGIIYPYPPKKQGLKELIESYLENYGTPAYWFTEIRGIE